MGIREKYTIATRIIQYFSKVSLPFSKKKELCREDKYNTYKTEGKKVSLTES